MMMIGTLSNLVLGSKAVFLPEATLLLDLRH
jgi:hypothetical protein